MVTRYARALSIIVCLTGLAAATAQAEPRYLWPDAAGASAADRVIDRIAPPEGFARIPAEPGSFAEWLRHLPLRAPQTPVRLYDGRLKWSQDRHVAVIAIDTGTRDLQQCADAIMRLRAEYLLSNGRARDIAFNYTNGKRVRYRGKASDRRAFQRYMTGVFAYAGTYSLEREMKPVAVPDMRIGDVFIKGGFPGHAVLVVDMVQNPATGEKRFLLMQSFMPAQDMHVLTSPHSPDGTPWYTMPEPDSQFITPEYIFRDTHLRRFSN